MFDMFPGNTPPDPTDFDDDAELQRAIDLAARSDVTVVVIGEWQHMIGESASRSSIELPGRQLELLQAIVATGTPTVALVMNGRPLDLRWAAEHVPAIVDIWYPGTQGGTAVAKRPLRRRVTGGTTAVHVAPLRRTGTARLLPHPQPRPSRAASSVLDEVGSPLYPFGFGLSYSSFEYGPVTLDRDEISGDETLHVTAAISNTGQRTADEVAQLYVHQVHGTASRPVRELKGFRRVTIESGATEHVTFTLGYEQLAYWNSAARDWVLDARPTRSE